MVWGWGGIWGLAPRVSEAQARNKRSASLVDYVYHESSVFGFHKFGRTMTGLTSRPDFESAHLQVGIDWGGEQMIINSKWLGQDQQEIAAHWK